MEPEPNVSKIRVATGMKITPDRARTPGAISLVAGEDKSLKPCDLWAYELTVSRSSAIRSVS